MDFFETVKTRRSIRRFENRSIPAEVILKAFSAAVLAPNSSNIQAWNFYWIRTPEKKEKLVRYCLNQSAAKTAAELFVIVADPKLWLRSNPRLILWATGEKAPEQVLTYYKKFIPFIYRWGFFNVLTPIKWLIFNVIGLFNPIMRSPMSKRDLQEVAIKSAALACENLVLGLTAQGVSSCMMEGFDERRVKSLLPISNSARVVMVIAAGYATEKGTWGERYRLQLEEVLHEV